MAEKPVRIDQRDVNFDQESRRSKKLQLLAHSSFEAEDHLLANGDRPKMKRIEDQHQLMTKKQMEANLKVRLVY